jgi:hypothetical protein
MTQKIILANYKDALTPYHREKGKYYCPACGGHNLSFSRDGKWNCWNNPTREHRLEIMAAMVTPTCRYVPDFKSNRSTYRPEILTNFTPKIYPAQLHFPLVKFIDLSQTVGNRTTHKYSESQRIVRYDYRNRKIIYPQYFNGKYWTNGAGDEPWIPFGLSRLFSYPGVINLILLVEGQKCVEIAHSRGIPALCLEGGDYSHQTMFDKLRAIRDRLERLLLVVLPDYDLDGNRKALQIIHTAKYFSLPTLLLDPLEIEPTLGARGDIEQMPSLNADRLMKIVKRMLSPPKQ